eukprot:2267383-Alexandrium_andersonii.AAC.1
MSDEKVLQLVSRWIRLGRLWYVHFATPCTAFSVANTCGTSKLRMGQHLARATVRLIRLCERFGVYWSLENPLRSKLWLYPPVRALLERPTVLKVEYHCCCYGSPFLKPTALYTSMQVLSKLARSCTGGHYHTHLQGRVRLAKGW